MTLVLYAPGKNRVSVISELAGNNWTEQSQYQMNKTPEGNYWWLTITGLTSGNVTVIQTNAPSYNWQTTSFIKPDKRNLIINELLLRDYTDAHNWQTMIDTLSYLQRHGVNAIELMPVNEFEGNDSWGYNPSFYFAPDKYYGTKNKLKQFIDSCHTKQIAVMLDLVPNHRYRQSPLVQLYWNSGLNWLAASNQ